MKIKLLNPLLLSDEQFLIIEDMAACNYSPNQIGVYLEVENLSAFCEYCLDGASSIWEAYERGKLKSEFEINQKLLENARKGNITAAQQFEKNREKVDMQDIIQKFFG